MDKDIDYCASQLRLQDYHRYVIPLVLTRKFRPALWALYTFNLELARIPHVATEPGLQAIRYQWWRDAVVQLPNAQAPAHPVLQSLQRHAGLVFDDLDNLVDAHESQGDVEGVLEALSLKLVKDQDHKKIKKIFRAKMDPSDPLLPLKLWWQARFA